MELWVAGFERVGKDGEAENWETGHFLIWEQKTNGGVFSGFWIGGELHLLP